MAKSFAAHHQIVCAILDYEGDNDFLHEKGGLSFGIRRAFCQSEEGDGVVLTDVAPQNIAETPAGRFVTERTAKGLKYSKPDIRGFENAFLTYNMHDILMSYMDEELMDDDVSEYWTKLMLEDNSYDEHSE